MGVSFYANGEQEGESTTYWANGRVRSVATFVGGKVVKSKSFPKFDRPIPAVVLRVEANENSTRPGTISEWTSIRTF